MRGSLTLNDFVEVTRNIASGTDEFLPTFADPAAREIKALEEVPTDTDISLVTREWAAQQDRQHYFIAYPDGGAIRAEEYEAGRMIAACKID